MVLLASLVDHKSPTPRPLDKPWTPTGETATRPGAFAKANRRSSDWDAVASAV
jgi:hypothetical protein